VSGGLWGISLSVLHEVAIENGQVENVSRDLPDCGGGSDPGPPGVAPLHAKESEN
jgi:hypothetical protein